MDPLTVSLILEQVFNYLSVEDMKRCRQVNKKWSYESTLVIRKYLATLPFGTTASLKKLISVAHQSPTIIPFTKFNLSSHLFSDEDCDPVLTEFFNVLGPDLESLSMTLDKDSRSISNSTIELENLPKLKQLSLTGYGLDGPNRDGVVQLLKVILRSCSKIESLSLIFDGECKQSVQSLIDLMASVQDRFRYLKTLEIYIPLGDHVLKTLTKMPFRLKTLKCDFHRSCFLQETLKGFLQAQSQSLEYLKFDNYYGNSCYSVDFPRMANVKTLKIDGKSELSSKEVKFLPFSYTKQFPSLDKLILGGCIQLNKCWGMVFQDGDRVESVKHLKLTAESIHPDLIEKMVFINLSSLYFVLGPKTEPMVERVFKCFSKLKSLTVYFNSTCNNVDHIFTGLSKDKCQMVRNNPEFLSLCGSSGSEEEKEKTSLLNMTRLEEICFKGENPNSSCITDVTVRLTLVHMPCLKTIKMHPFHVSTETLQLLKEKFKFSQNP